MSSDKPTKVSPEGIKQWFIVDANGQEILHRDEDKPAVIYPTGKQEWWQNGKLSRHEDNGPAVIWSDGAEEWWYESNRHRLGGPAFTLPNGSYKWYLYGLLHREDDLPAVVMKHFESKEYCSDDEVFVSREWWVNGACHRIGKPAVEYSCGDKYYYEYGNLHRLDGPAIDTNENQEWFVEGLRHRENGLPAVCHKLDYFYETFLNGDYSAKDGEVKFILEWWCDGKRTREDDLPAYIGPDKMEWWEDGVLHRENDKPAIVRTGTSLNSTENHDDYYPNGNSLNVPEHELHAAGYKNPLKIQEEWWYRGKLHRENGLPAQIGLNGYNAWYENGHLHRDYGLPAFIDPEYGFKEWWVRGEKITNIQASFIYCRTKKIAMRHFNLWKDYAYRFGTDAQRSRLEREMKEDMEILENRLGYTFS